MVGKLLPLLLLPVVLPAQPTLDGETARVFRFAHAGSPQLRQEIANVVRSVGDVQRVAVDGRAGVLAVRGTPEQLELVAWIFGELDRTAGAPAATTVESYKTPGDYLPQVRVFFLAHGDDPRTVQEIVNTVRSVGDLQRVYAYSGKSAIVLRGNADQVELADWLIRNLDRPAGVLSEEKPLEHTYNDAASSRPQTAVRMYRMSHSTTSQALEEAVDAIRTVSDANRVTVNTAIATITLRATPAQAAMATWLVHELDRSPAEPK